MEEPSSPEPRSPLAEFESAWTRRLAGNRPGHAGLSAPPQSASGEAEPTTRAAAVLVLLYPTERGPTTLLTIRSPELRSHAGQVSFPGGALEPAESPEAGALREAREEIGFDGSVVHLGSLTPVFVPPTRFLVQPVVAFTANRPSLEPHPGEVAAVIELALNDLLPPAAISYESRMVSGSERSMPFHQVGDHKIWGATALVLSELAELWREVKATL